MNKVVKVRMENKRLKMKTKKEYLCMGRPEQMKLPEIKE
jgi:hypothetical protein